MFRRDLLRLGALVLAGTIGFGTAEARDEPVLAFATNAAADFWTIGRAGVMQAGEEFDGYTTEMHIVSAATAAEQLMIVPTRVIDASNVEAFRGELQQLLAQ